MHKINKLAIVSVMALFLAVSPSTSYAFAPLTKILKGFTEWVTKKFEPDDFIPPEKLSDSKNSNNSFLNSGGNTLNHAATRLSARCLNQYNESKKEAGLESVFKESYLDSPGLKIDREDHNLESDLFGVGGDEESKIADSELCDYDPEIESHPNKELRQLFERHP